MTKRGDGRPVPRDAATKTANERTLALDAATVAVEQLRAEREQFGPWMFGVGDELVNPDRIGYWWRQARNKAGIDSGGGCNTTPPPPGRPLWPSRRVTTCARSLVASATPTRR